MFHEIYENLQESITEQTVELWESVLKNERADHNKQMQLKKLYVKLCDRQKEQFTHEKDYKQAFTFLNQHAVQKKSRVEKSYFQILDKFRNVQDLNKIDVAKLLKEDDVIIFSFVLNFQV